MGLKDMLQKKREDPGKEVLATAEDREAARRNKYVALLVLGALICFVLAFSWDLIFKENKPSGKRKVDTPKGAVTNTLADESRLERDWKSNMENELKSLKEEQKTINNEVLGKLKEIKDSKESKPKDYPPKQLKEIAPIPHLDSNRKGYQQAQENPGPNSLQQPGQNPWDRKHFLQPSQRTPPVQLSPSFKRFEFKFESKQGAKLKDEKIIPMGFAVGLALNGADTPTFQWGQQDPQPILISIESDFITASGKPVEVQGCFLTSSFHGAVSSQRGLGRFVSMECRDKKNGDLYDGSVEGWVLGDDGKIGIHGRLVSKQGEVMSKAAFVGVIDGIANIVKSQSTTVSVSPLGATQTIDPAKVAQAGASQGFINTTDRLQQWYIKYLDQIHPIVEILPGRKVTVVFTRIAKLKKVTAESLDEEKKVAQKDSTPHGSKN